MSIRLRPFITCGLVLLAALLSACVPADVPIESTGIPLTQQQIASPVGSAFPVTTVPPVLTLESTPSSTPDMLSQKLTAIAFDTQSPTHTPIPQGPPDLGIIEGAAPPYNTDVFRSGNQWNGYVGDILTFVFVGVRVEDPQQGVVIIEHPTLGGWYDSPEKHGILRATAAVGSVLTLTAADGFVYHFDVSTASYVSMNDATPATQVSDATAAAP